MLKFDKLIDARFIYYVNGIFQLAQLIEFSYTSEEVIVENLKTEEHERREIQLPVLWKYNGYVLQK